MRDQLHSRRVWMVGFLSAAAIAGLLLVAPFGRAQGNATADRLLNGAIDIHLHIDPMTYGADTSTLRFAKSKGVRAVVVKNHYEPTVDLGLLLRREVPGIQIVGGIDLNWVVGGINRNIVDHMGQVLTGTGNFRKPAEGALRTGIVWLTTLDSETAVKAAKQDRPFLTVAKNGQLVPEIKDVIGLLAKYQLVLATGHNSPAEGLLMLREGKARGVNHMVMTHAMDNPIFANVAQMKEAVSLGALIEVDIRRVLTEKGQADAVKQVGPENVILSEFLMPAPNSEPLKYPYVDNMGQFADQMRALGFTDQQLIMMLQRNPARLLGMPVESTR